METINKVFSLTDEMLDELVGDIFAQCDFHRGSDEMYHFTTEKQFDYIVIQLEGWVYYSMSKPMLGDEPEVNIQNIDINKMSVNVNTAFDKIELENEILKRIND